MKQLFRVIVVSAVLIFSFMSSAHSVNKADIQTLFDQWRIKNQIPGASLYFQTSHQHILLQSGTTTLEGKSPVRENTLFGVGSITKTFVSAMVLKLEAQNKFDINDTMGRYLPQYPRWKNITLKQLLNMTSGIPDFYSDQKFKDDIRTNPNSDWTPERLIQLAYNKQDSFLPGKTWEYSNTNYLLLGKIIEKVTKTSLPIALEKNLFQPSGLKNIFYSETSYSPAIIQQMAHGYYNNIDMTNMKPSNYGAAGAMVMSNHDLAAWISDLLVKQIVLPPKQLKEMLDGVPIPKGLVKPANTKYGLGVSISQDNQFGEMIWYTGVVQGYSAVFIWIPREKVLITAQINRWQDKNYDLLFPQKDLVQQILGKLKVDKVA